jgi:hypothetical protein
MRNVVNQENFSHYPVVLDLIKKSEQLFRSIQVMETVVPLQAEEKLFIEAIRDLNYQASRMQAEEQQDTLVASGSGENGIAGGSPRPVSDATIGKEKQITTSLPSLNLINQSNAITAQPLTSVDSLTIEISEKLDSATSVLVDVATRLNTSEASPSLSKVLSWMQTTQPDTATLARHKKHGQDGNSSNTDVETSEENDIIKIDQGSNLGRRAWEESAATGTDAHLTADDISGSSGNSKRLKL